MNKPTTELLTELDEARETVAYHQQCMRFHLRLAKYWYSRVLKLEAELPALVEAEEVAQTCWEVTHG